MLTINNAEFVKSIVNINQAPKPELPEFAFAGRSNVGKSSLINCLLNRKKLANVSKQPGKTRTINYFLVNQDFYLVDLPGYGFAKVAQKEKESWAKMIEDYITGSKNLRVVFSLIDISVGPQKNDIQLLEWLHHKNIPHAVIATKADRAKQSDRRRSLETLKEHFPEFTESHWLVFSSKDKTGRKELLAFLDKQLKNS
ncbi:MAG: ribosome biogenesis GTP-binding protein YihA/YsxC [Calditrichia bacterium]